MPQTVNPAPVVPPLGGDSFWPIAITLAQLLIAIRFFVDAVAGGFSMSPIVHGYAVWYVPAEAWSGVLVLVHGSILAGLLLKGRRGALFIITGGAVGSLVNLSFSVAANDAEFGGIVVYFAEGLLLPLCVVFTVQGVMELRRGNK